MGRSWRLLPLRAGYAALNMAVDEAVFRAYAEGRVPPTLRFYTWTPPAVSLGRYQDAEAELDRRACRELGFGAVKRPTGGRAVLHLGDLTYAVAAGEADGVPAGVLPSYLHFSRGLVAGLARLGITAELHTPASRASGSPSCFSSPSWYELTVAGKKVAGSAQRREGPNVLQHGAVMIDFHPVETARVLRWRGAHPDPAAGLAISAAGLGDWVPGLDAGVLAGALELGFAEALGISFAAGDLTDYERDLTAALIPAYTEGGHGPC
ncbi:MAG: biotin/lipoate A/B protein ligase family protein [Patescibacteria group bacterium]